MPNINRGSLTRSIALLSLLLAFTTPTFAATPVPFSNTAPITINDNGNAALYPQINVAGVSTFTIEIRLNGFTHTFPMMRTLFWWATCAKGGFDVGRGR